MEPQAYEELHRLEGDHWWYRGMRQITDRLLREALGETSGLSILDTGCGTGGNLAALAGRGRVCGFDSSPQALAYACQNHRDTLARASVEAIPYPANTFDLVTSFDVIYSSGIQDDVRALAEMARVTRPGGHVFVRVPALPALRGPHDAVVHGVRRYTAREMRHKLEAAGLIVQRLTYANSLLLPPVFVARRLQSLFARQDEHPPSDVRPTPALLNRLLAGVLALEAGWIGGGRSFPAGVSLIALATKPGQRTT